VGPQPHYRLIFNRIAVLATLKALIAVSNDDDEANASYENAKIGELVLRANDFISSRKIREIDKDADELDLAIEFLPIWELMNPREIGYGLARMYLLVTNF
jgi:hypothetical protein